jgi:hypothetical protein
MSKEKEKEKVKLKITDWDLLLPGTNHQIASTTIIIKPLGLEDYGQIIKRIGIVLADWSGVIEHDKKITIVDQIKLMLPKISDLIINHAIDILSDMSGIDIDDCKKLPPVIAIELLEKCFEINILSLEGMEKNLKALMESIMKIMPKANQNSEK